MYQQILKHVELGEPITCGDLTVTPLRWDRSRVPAGGESPWLAACEAFERGLLAPAKAVGGERTVGAWVRNRSGRPVLVPDGQILPGAEEAGEVDLSVLVPPGGAVRLPLARPERRFWRRPESAARWKRIVAARKPEEEDPGVYCLMDFDLDDDRGRREPGRILERMRYHLDCAFWTREEASRRIRDPGLFWLWESDQPCIQRLHAAPVPEQAGVLLAFEEKVLAMELFGHPGLYAPHHASALRARAIWERDPGDPLGWPEFLREPGAFLDELARCVAAPVTGSEGLGTLWRIDGPMVGMALTHDDRLVHLVAIHVPEVPEPEEVHVPPGPWPEEEEP